ncbi:type 2 isopentenyl-diphosphate Delta-isomerase [candidate division KSB1 bacterium]|nr:type 2 isopentenyl-diphosphate Delta-isomerase [candidate division KSB1 bacterium]
MSYRISARKEEHLEICATRDVKYRRIGSGFDTIQLRHCALPEIDFKDVDTGTKFLNKALAFPFMITAMTGGFKGAEDVNKMLAEVCYENRIALGLGSQRQLIENSNFLKSYQLDQYIKRQIPVIGNIGAAQIIHQRDREKVRQLVEMVETDALAIHLNPLQEILQREGDPDFSGVLIGIEKLITMLPIPVIVKETGAGISKNVALALKSAGVSIIDVSGAGGTSWAAVEAYRNSDNDLCNAFWDWGIPTVLCLEEVAQIDGIVIIASGGISNGIDIAKALALGANLTGAARPLLDALYSKGVAGLNQVIKTWHLQFKTAMFLTGCRSVSDLKAVECIDIRDHLK